jgi:putative tryptophan/tyrosine transport system substrate-binding protein
MNRRRKALIALGVTALGRPLAGLTQGQRVFRVAYLSIDPSRSNPLYQAFSRAMHDHGWIEGINVEYIFRASGGLDEHFSNIAAEVVRANVDVIVTVNSGSTKAAMQATAHIPIIFGSAANPVEQKFVTSLARPGGNVTGLALLVQELGSKRLQLLKEMLPHAKRFARIYQANSVAAIQPTIMTTDDAAARALGVTLEHVPIKVIDDIGTAFSTFARKGVNGVHVASTPLFVLNRDLLAALALKYRLPLICPDSRYVEAGALASYGEDQVARFRTLATLVDKVLRGRMPVDLPVEQPMTFELALNLRTAKAMNLSIPDVILLQASRLIG